MMTGFREVFGMFVEEGGGGGGEGKKEGGRDGEEVEEEWQGNEEEDGVLPLSSSGSLSSSLGSSPSPFVFPLESSLSLSDSVFSDSVSSVSSLSTLPSLEEFLLDSEGKSGKIIKKKRVTGAFRFQIFFFYFFIQIFFSSLKYTDEMVVYYAAFSIVKKWCEGQDEGKEETEGGWGEKESIFERDKSSNLHLLRILIQKNSNV